MLKNLDPEIADALLWGVVIFVWGMYLGTYLGQMSERAKRGPVVFPQPSEAEQRANRAAQRAYLDAMDGK